MRGLNLRPDPGDGCYLDGKLVAELTGSTMTYPHTDALGSPVARTNSSKVITARTQYEPYGDTFDGTDPVGIGYAGHVNDISTGLSDQQQRYYDPLLGRFITADPVVTDLNSGGNFNRYWYGNNSPYRYRDPDGREPITWADKHLIANIGLSATLFKRTGLGVIDSKGNELQGFTVSLTTSVNLTAGQIALSAGANEVSGTGAYVGGGVVVGGGVNKGPLTNGTSGFEAAEGAVGVGEVSGGLQATANTDSVGGSSGTRFGVGAGAYVGKGSGSQSTLTTPPLTTILNSLKDFLGL